MPIEQFRQAAALIEDKILKTPLVNSPALSRMFGGEIYLKLENLQKTGSFKIRGATFKLLKCMDNIGPGGVVAASAGNHAQGVALAARQLGIPATIVMPEWVSISKEEATLMYGGQVVISGHVSASAWTKRSVFLLKAAFLSTRLMTRTSLPDREPWVSKFSTICRILTSSWYRWAAAV